MFSTLNTLKHTLNTRRQMDGVVLLKYETKGSQNMKSTEKLPVASPPPRPSPPPSIFLLSSVASSSLSVLVFSFPYWAAAPIGD